MPALRQLEEPVLKLRGEVGVQTFGMDRDDDNVSLGLGCKWHRTSSQKRRCAWRSLYIWWATSLTHSPVSYLIDNPRRGLERDKERSLGDRMRRLSSCATV